MSLSSEIPRAFRLYVTHVDGEGYFIRIRGQLDTQASLMVEYLFETAREKLDQGIGAASRGTLHEGIICAAKHKNGTYYRVRVINTTNIATGFVGVQYIDHGSKDIISQSTIRFLDSYDPLFMQLRGQASDFYLSRFMNPSGIWEQPLLMKLQSLLCYSEYPVTLDVQTQTLPIISIQFKGNDLTKYLVSFCFGRSIPIAKQKDLLLQVSKKQYMPNWHPHIANDTLAYPEHVPFFLNQNCPSNPVSAMQLQQNVPLPFNGSIPATPSLVSQRLNDNKTSQTTVNLKAGSVSSLVQSTSPPATHPAFAAAKSSSLKEVATYKSKLLEVNSQHKVFVSYAEGPELFVLQLADDAKKLNKMMYDINVRPHRNLTEPPNVGTVCLGRMPGDRMICRAIVMNLSGSQCKLFFVDFGDTEIVSYYDIFDIPEEFVKPNAFAMRFCMSGVKKLEKGPHLNETFKRLAFGKLLTLKVVAPEGPPLIQYGELYLDNRNLLDLLLANMKNKLQFRWLDMLPLGAIHSVLVSYVDSCTKFYIQLLDNIDDLNAVMDVVKVHCETSSSPGELPLGASCCARFPYDGNWYRARVREIKGDKIVVAYVDYGNEQEVDVSDLRTITPDLIRLPAVAMKCALKGFENIPVERETSNQLEMLALEKTLMAHVVGVLYSDTMLVSLVDDTVSPPLDVARKLNQLSQPRSSQKVKTTTPVRKDAPESIGSPEGSENDDGRKRSFRREKSFKDARRPREGNNETSQPAGSFSTGDNRFNQVERKGRNNDEWGSRTERLGGRPDRRDSRGYNRSDNRGKVIGERRDNYRDFGNEDRSDFGSNRGKRGGHGRPRSNFTPRDRVDRQNKPGTSSQRSGDRSGRPPFKPRSKFTQVQYKEISDPVSLDTPFEEPTVELGTQHDVSVTWILSPESFYIQILSLQPKFLDMMRKIPELYKGVKPYSGNIPVGASVLAYCPADGVLYRATVVSEQQFSKFIVRFVDFGNKQLVDTSEIWQLDRELLELPKMAVHCSLIGVAPKDGEWKADIEFDLCFNAPRYQCVFQEATDNQYKVSLRSNGVNVADTLVGKQLAVMSEHPSSVALKDEPITMIIVGQQILCRVTHVESYEKFHVHLDIEKAELVEQTIANYDVAKLTSPAPEFIVEGYHCTVKYEGKICRAILKDTSDKANITALLSDYGNMITTTLDNVLILPTELSVYYMQSLQCSLHNYSADSETLMSLEEMKAKLTNNKFIIYINYVDEITLVSTLYEATTGQKVSIFTPDEGAYDEVVPLCMCPVFNNNFGMAYVCHAESLNKFYLQKAADGNRLAQLLEDLYKFYEEGTREPLTTFEVGGICIAKSTDGYWYRASIVTIEDTEVKVHFTDYGNSETVTKDSLKKLDLKFYEPCSLALVASLGLVPLQDGALTIFAEWTTKKEVQVTLTFRADGWLANLHLDGVDLSMKLINEKLATPQVVSEGRDAPEGHAARSKEVKCGDLLSCFASHVNSPSEFWIQLQSAAPELLAMETAMDDAENFPELTEKEEGVICAAKYPEDGMWYRAQVIVNGSEGTEVLFMDYGNISIAYELRSLTDDLKNIPVLSRKCALQKPRGNKSWSRKSESKFNELAADGATIFDVQFITSGDISIVELYLEGKSVTEELVGICEELPVATERPEPVGQFYEATGTSVEKLNMSIEETITVSEDAQEELAAESNIKKLNTNIEESASAAKEVPEELSIEKSVEQLNTSLKKTVIVTKEPAKSTYIAEISDRADKIIDILVKEPEKLVESEKIESNDELEKEQVHYDVNKAEHFDDAEGDLDTEKRNTTDPDLDECIDSTHTVFVNKFFDAQADSLSDDIRLDEDKTDAFTAPEKDLSSGTLENSNDTIKTPEREESKDSIKTDTSCGDHDKSFEKETDSCKYELSSGSSTPESREKKQPGTPKLDRLPKKKSSKLSKIPEKKCGLSQTPPEKIKVEMKEVKSNKSKAVQG